MIPLALSVPHGIWNSPTINWRPTGHVRGTGSGCGGRPDVLVPRPDRGEDRRRRDSRSRQRDDDPDQRADPGAAINARRLFKIGRNTVEKAFQHPDAEWQEECGVGEGKTDVGVVKMDPAEQDEERN